MKKSEKQINSGKKNGFTLIEILLVIALMGALITGIYTNYINISIKGRNTKRKSDLQEIKTSLEQFYSVCGFVYPTPQSEGFTGISCTSPNIEIMQNIPKDPHGKFYYCPTPVATNCSSSSFMVCSKLEAETQAEYCVKNSQ